MIRAVGILPGLADDPPAVLHYINRHFEFLWDTPMYATATYAVLDGARGTLRLASAGHPLPLIASRNGNVATASTDTTMCLLWNELKDVPCSDYPLAPGDRWVFFTDGITDRQPPDWTISTASAWRRPCAHCNRAPPTWSPPSPVTRPVFRRPGAGRRPTLLSSLQIVLIG